MICTLFSLLFFILGTSEHIAKRSRTYFIVAAIVFVTFVLFAFLLSIFLPSNIVNIGLHNRMTLYIELFSIVFLGMIRETLFIPFYRNCLENLGWSGIKGSRMGFNDGKN